MVRTGDGGSLWDTAVTSAKCADHSKNVAEVAVQRRHFEGCAVTGDAAKDHKVGHGSAAQTVCAVDAASYLTGLSKVTVRRYLNYLIGTNEAESQVDYSTGGRPRVEYQSR